MTNEDIKEEVNTDTTGLVLPIEKYLESGIHIGTKLRNGDTAQFIYKKRKDGIYILAIEKIDEHLRQALNILKEYDPRDICIVATRTYSTNPASKIEKFVSGLNIISGRFIPGTFTNPASSHFREPEIVLVCDPRSEGEAIKEANLMQIPVVGLVDTDNSIRGINHIVPMNNKGRKSLALFFWLLARELLLKTGKISSYDEFKVPINYFEKLDLGETEEG
jgi:small subunit ribosomal protein S2